jgi:hypothetical protein
MGGGDFQMLENLNPPNEFENFSQKQQSQHLVMHDKDGGSAGIYQ